jgi:predicted ATPase
MWIAEQRYGQAPLSDTGRSDTVPPPHNLQPLLTTFVGRERDMREARQLLQRDRLLVIVGPGGCGKTRLAVQVATDTLQQYPGGVWFVGLSLVNDADTIALAIAEALDVPEREGTSPLAAVTSELGRRTSRRPTLLLLDNCEHLTHSCAATVVTLLAATTHLKLLCTSREPLHVSGEQIMRIGPLSLPDADAAHSPAAVQRSEAVRLFLDRAGLADPGYTIDESNANQVADLCLRVDGMPLALELAAARVGLLAFDQILAHLEGRISALRPHGAPDRQQTVTATIEWSYDLLSAAERLMLRRLAVFRAGFTLEAADAVCRDSPSQDAGETLENLVLLADKSLVQTVPPERKRFRCLELVRRYAWTQLADSGELYAMVRRHNSFYLEVAEQAAAELTSTAQPAWLARLADEHHNMRAALQFCRTDSPERLQRFVVALYRFWFIRGHLSEGRTWAEVALESTKDEQNPLLAQVLSVAASLAWQQGDLARANGWYEECLAVWRSLGDPRGVQYSLGNLGLVAWKQGHWEAARARYDESLALAQENGDEREVGIVLLNLGSLSAHTGDLGNGLAYLHKAIQFIRPLGDQSLIASALASLGDVELQAGSDADARDHYGESLRLQHALGARGHVSDCLDGLASIAARQGRKDRALRLAGAAASIRQAVGAVAEPSSRRLIEAWLDQARAETDGERAWNEGGELSDQEAIALALDETG